MHFTLVHHHQQCDNRGYQKIDGDTHQQKGFNTAATAHLADAENDEKREQTRNQRGNRHPEVEDIPAQNKADSSAQGAT